MPELFYKKKYKYTLFIDGKALAVAYAIDRAEADFKLFSYIPEGRSYTDRTVVIKRHLSNLDRIWCFFHKLAFCWWYIRTIECAHDWDRVGVFQERTGQVVKRSE